MIPVTSTKNGQPVGPYSPAILFNNLIFLSGQIGIDRENNLAKSLESQCEQIFANIDNLLQEIGSIKSQIIKTEIFITDMDNYHIINKIYAEYLEGLTVLPARTTVEVARLPKDALIEISIIAYK
jgi:2-iminobutanoate/2-iminopropanoate deaminase